MSAAWELLEWDSDFLGIGIGSVVLDDADPTSIAAVESEARAAGVECLYGRLDPTAYDLIHAAQTWGFKFTEAALRFDLDHEREVVFEPTDSRIRRGTVDDVPRVQAALLRLAPWSRYAVDPRFGIDVAHRMNLAWVERAARSEDDDLRLTVAENSSGITAFMCSARRPAPFADMVGSTEPGSGDARALMQESIEWGGPQLGCGWAAARNVRSIRFVEGCGFQVAEVRYLYHRWLVGDD